MDKNIKFEEAILKLEAIVEKLEAGDIALDESVQAFEEGNNLVKLCMEKLNSVEKRIKSLSEPKDSVTSNKKNK